MPNSKARRAQHQLVAAGFSFLLALGIAASSATFSSHAVRAAEPTELHTANPSGPPQQITVSFSERDNLIDRLRRQGVADGEAQSIDKLVRSALTPAQRQTGALVQLSFGGDQWPWTVQEIRVEPLKGSATTLDRNAMTPLQAAAPSTVKPQASAAPAPTQTAPAAAAPTAATAPAIEPSVAVVPASIAPKAKFPDVVGPLSDPFADVSSTSKLAPQAGAIDPEWPVQPPKPSATAQQPAQALVTVRGKLGADIVRSLQDGGVPARIASDIAQAVAQHAPLRNSALAGRRFDVTYEPTPDASVGFILADFAVEGGRERIWRHRPEGGVTGFYTDDGVRIGGLAIQSPVPGAPIVSPYGMRRHPVLKVDKMHWGVDYAANMGVPILAAADGIVEDVRRLGNYGLYIRLSHKDGIETTYGHMSKFEPGLTAGMAVKAGQVIGYSGRSGLASGPHLYFEVLVEGKRVNPEHMVSDQPVRLDGTDLALFESLKQRATAVQTAAEQQ